MRLLGLGGTNSAWIARIAAAWALLGLLLAAQAWLSYAIRNEPIAWTRSLAVWLSWAGFWALLTPVALRLVERFPIERRSWWWRLIVHLIASVVLASLNLALFAVVAPWVGAQNVEATWWATFSRLMGTAFLLNLPVYWLMIGASQAVRAAKVAREREKQTLALQAQLAEARLQALRAQIKPHFLFNALNTVAVLMKEDVALAEHVLLRVCELLRSTLSADDSHQIPLRDELALVEAYLSVEQLRLGERLSYQVSAEPETLSAPVPPLVLQTLVENAVEHGIAPRRAPGCIEVTAARVESGLRLIVSDNGLGMADAATEGIGLRNIRTRLALLYGDRQRLELQPAAEGRLVARIDIPMPNEPER